MDPFTAAGFPIPPQLQRNRDYTRQRTMTIGDMLLENRIIFLGTIGSSYFADAHGEASISHALINARIKQLAHLQPQTRTPEILFYLEAHRSPAARRLAHDGTSHFFQ